MKRERRRVREKEVGRRRKKVEDKLRENDY